MRLRWSRLPRATDSIKLQLSCGPEGRGEELIPHKPLSNPLAIGWICSNDSAAGEGG